ncbi:MAG: hypothetical protein ACK5RL_18310 [Acidimicrobiales bacterium]
MSPASAPVTGVDVGGSQIRAGLVDVPSGTVIGDIQRVSMPRRAGVDQVADLVRLLGRRLGQDLDHCPHGVALPVRLRYGEISEATHLGYGWQGTPVANLPRALRPAVNDADAVGFMLSETEPPRPGLTVVLTFGTGIGSSMVKEGRVITSTELGILRHDDTVFEEACSGRTVTERNLDGSTWARLTQPFIDWIEALLGPDEFVVAGGLVERYDQYFGQLSSEATIRPCPSSHEAGIIGAALTARGSL